jgi:hypothetical protein
VSSDSVHYVLGFAISKDSNSTYHKYIDSAGVGDIGMQLSRSSSFSEITRFFAIVMGWKSKSDSTPLYELVLITSSSSGVVLQESLHKSQS